MIIPIKCFTCGKVLADLYLYYKMAVREIKMKENTTEEIQYLTVESSLNTAESRVLNDLGLVKMCCRRHMLSHVDIE